MRILALIAMGVTFICTLATIGIMVAALQVESPKDPVPRKPPGAYRVKCNGCGQEFWSTRPGDVEECPDCREVPFCEYGIRLAAAAASAEQLARANPSNEVYRRQAEETAKIYAAHARQCPKCED